MMRSLFSIATTATLLISACGKPAEQSASEIGSSLSDKSAVDIEAVPAAVMSAARSARPDVVFTEAERELRNGVIYFDVGGKNEAGEEIELDIMQDGDGWKVVEIQRDLAYEQIPALVRNALEAQVPGVSPDRIIESDQTDGVIIYEFFTRADDGTETKYEVKYAGGEAEFLTEEWAH